MAEENLDELERDPKSLREKYEKLLRDHKSLETEVTGFRASKVIEEKGFTFVKPEDLEGVAPSKIEERAAELQEQRREARAEVAKDIFAKQGYDGEELDQVVEQFLAGEAPVQTDPVAEEARAFERARSLDRQNATPPAALNVADLHGTAAIEHGLAKVPARKR